MKIFIAFLTVVLLFHSNFIYSKKIPATITLKEGTTIESLIKIRRYPLSFKGAIQYPRLQNKIKYYDTNGKKHKLYAEQIKEFRFSYKQEEIKMQTIKLGHRLHEGFFVKHSDYILLKKKTEGNLNRFVYFHNTNFLGLHLKMTFSVLQKGDEEGFVPKWFNDFKDLSKYISDCPSLVDKINNNTYNSQNIVDIVKEYNVCTK